ncbi:MAG: hypothetical protein R3324_05475, partial [Halobacteriales archaeon]|nr:hypothetical protein [Halobacteriales archaeon]
VSTHSARCRSMAASRIPGVILTATITDVPVRGTVDRLTSTDISVIGYSRYREHVTHAPVRLDDLRPVIQPASDSNAPGGSLDASGDEHELVPSEAYLATGSHGRSFIGQQTLGEDSNLSQVTPPVAGIGPGIVRRGLRRHPPTVDQKPY